MILLVAVCAMGIAKGAAVDWKFGKDTSLNGYTVYAFDNANSATVLAALGAFDAAAKTTVEGLVLSSETVKKGNASKDGADIGSATSLMLLAINGDFEVGKEFKYDTLDIAGYTYSGTDLPPGTATLASFGNSGTIVGVPEPTSGLLMLVGLGLLGLRRKQK